MPIDLLLGRDAPLSQAMGAAYGRLYQAQTVLAELGLAEVTRLIRDPFPQASAIYLEAPACAETAPPLVLDSIAGARQVWWSRTTGTPDRLRGYATRDGATLDRLLGEVRDWLQDSLGDRYPDTLWRRDPSSGLYQVELLSPENLNTVLHDATSTLAQHATTPRVQMNLTHQSDGSVNVTTWLDGQQITARVTML